MDRPDPITELPLLEATAWESAVDAATAGDEEWFDDMRELLAEFGYELLWDGAVLALRHLHTGQEMRRRVG